MATAITGMAVNFNWRMFAVLGLFVVTAVHGEWPVAMDSSSLVVPGPNKASSGMPTIDIVIDADPTSFIDGATEHLTINCTFLHGEDPDFMAHLSLILSKTDSLDDGVFKELATITAYQRDTVNVKNNSLQADVTGNMPPMDDAFIALQWTYPENEVAGQYKCQSHWLDNTGHPRDSVVITQVNNKLDLDSVMDTLKDMDTLYTELKANQSNTVAMLENCKATLVSHEAQIHNNNISINDLREHKTNTTALLNKYIAELDQNKVDLDQIKSEITGLTAFNAHMTVVMNNYRADIAQNEAEITQNKQELDKNKVEIEDLKAYKANTTNVLDSFKSELDQCKKDTTKNTAELDGAKAEIEKLKANNANITATLDNYENELASNKAQLDQNKADIDQCKRDINILNAYRAFTNVTLNGLRSEIDRNEIDISKNKQTIGALEAYKTESSAQLSNYSTQLGELSKANAHTVVLLNIYQSELDRNSAEINALKQFKANATAELQSLRSALAMLQSSDEEAFALLDSYEIKINTNKADLEKSKTDVNDLKAYKTESSILINKTKSEVEDMKTCKSNSAYDKLDKADRVAVEAVSSFRCHTYHLTRPATLQLSQNQCEKHGGYPAEINDQAEYEFIIDLLRSQQVAGYVAVGGKDQSGNGTWVFGRSGEAMPYFHWYSGNPDESRPGAHCMFITHFSHVWGMDDVVCDGFIYYGRSLCEIPY